MDLRSGDKVFCEARDQFLASLSPKERDSFTPIKSAGEFLEKVKALHIPSKDRRWFQRCIKKIAEFGSRLAPYFSTIDILIQSHPEFAALAWGGIRLALQLASNFATFFEKLSGTLERIAAELPQYASISIFWRKSGKEVPARVATSLIRVYTDILRFFQSVISIFMKKDGGPKRAPFVVADLFWKPFDARFQDLIQDLKFHRELLMDEMTLAGQEEALNEQQAASEERKKQAQERLLAADARDLARDNNRLNHQAITMLEAQHRETVLHRAKQWLAPPEFSKDFERARRLRDTGTAEWIFEERLFLDWRHAQTPDMKCGGFGDKVLWVKGNPGCGKTVLAASVIEELRDSVNSHVYYYFFRNDASNNDSDVPAAAYRSILAQLLQFCQYDRDMIDRFALAMSETSSGQLIASEDELAELFNICLTSTGGCFIVLDGVDECQGNETLAQTIQQVVDNRSSKFLVFSRANVESLSTRTLGSQQLLIGTSTSGDIALFCSRRLETLRTSRLLPPGIDVSNLLRNLATGADGMFLWAKLMIDFLKSPALTPGQRIRTIQEVTLPEGLDTMYLRIVRLICSHGHIVSELAKNIFIWLGHSNGALSIRELQEAVNSTNLQDGAELENYTDFEQTVLFTCANLVERSMLYDSRHRRQVYGFRFIHLSALEFFCTPVGALNNFLWTAENDAHSIIARSCLRHLTYCLPAQPLGGEVGKDVNPSILDRNFPFCDYSASNWIHHLYSALGSKRRGKTVAPGPNQHFQQSLEALSRFLRHKLVVMSWIEASYVFKHEIPHSLLREWAFESAQRVQSEDGRGTDIQAILDDATELSQYLEKLEHEWGKKMARSPSIIWEDVTAFTPSRLLLENSAAKVYSLVAETPTGANIGTSYLCKISENTPGGEAVGVLSVWPSREYELRSSKNRLISDLSELRGCMSGWIARYEVWSIKQEPLRAADVVVPLDEEQVVLQFQQSFWCHRLQRKFAMVWKLQFPLSISPDARSFTVLNKVYSLRPSDKTGVLGLVATSLPLEDGHQLKVLNPDADQTPLNVTHTAWASQNAGMQRQRLSSADLYLYWLTWSPDSRLVYFMDNEPKRPSTLAVFKVADGEAFAMHSVGHVTTVLQTGTDGSRNFNAVFHPHRPLIAFTVARTVFLWAFHQVTKEFSSDTLKINNLTAPSIPHLVSSMLLEPPPMIDTGMGEVDKSQDKTLTSNLTTEPNALDFARREIVKSYVVEVKQNGDSTGVLTSQRDTNISITLRNNNGEKETSQSFELVKLPDWAGIEKVSAAVQLPRTKDEIIKIILNKAANRWNHATELSSGPEYLPAVIEKDQGAIKATQNHNRKRKLVASQSGTNLKIDELRPFGVGETTEELPASKRFQVYREGDGIPAPASIPDPLQPLSPRQEYESEPLPLPPRTVVGTYQPLPTSEFHKDFQLYGNDKMWDSILDRN